MNEGKDSVVERHGLGRIVDHTLKIAETSKEPKKASDNDNPAQTKGEFHNKFEAVVQKENTHHKLVDNTENTAHGEARHNYELTKQPSQSRDSATKATSNQENQGSRIAAVDNRYLTEVIKNRNESHKANTEQSTKTDIISDLETIDRDVTKVEETIKGDAKDNMAHGESEVESIIQGDQVGRNISSECIPQLHIDDTDKTGISIGSRGMIDRADGIGGDTGSDRVQWTLNDTNLEDLKEEVRDPSTDKLLLPSTDVPRRVSFGDQNISIKEYELFADRRKSEGMGYDMRQKHYRKHSSGDLHSRLKTRKLLGVGETDDGDVHRSKLSQILGHSDQLYIRLPSGLRIWQILLAILFSVMSLWALIFPSHYFVSMYEIDGQGYTFPVRLYASALVCIAVMYWSTIQASDRDVIRLVLLSSIVFFALQTLVTGLTVLTSYELMTRRTVTLLVFYTLFALIGYYFQRGVGVSRGGTMRRTTSNKELSEKDQ